MPFRFAHICDLLERLDQVYSRYPPYLPKDATQKSRDAVLYWFEKHGQKIRHDANGLALLSTLFPDRTQRVYGLDSKSLEKIICRALSLPSSRVAALTRWREPGAGVGDLGACVERVVDQDVKEEAAVQPRASGVTIEDIEQVLVAFARQTPPSPPHSRPLAVDETCGGSTASLGRLYQRLPARESKWLTRLILKSYSPVIVPEHLVYMLYHPFLPGVLEVEPDFSAALFLLRGMNIPALIH
ncbi:hypothetical protein VC83_01764 [Pseudogymnoascus destructans]|uniref:DNA ligase ATP-dependent N-terminal domain-containing protein n=2 Tax=Pseudogymnoascus destructans TaxID=655981 RepID=L8GA02_PSED2|nr:uncharacterized protein VC83_01764 [Pseudogymnoascus destructans]ELR08871.1 hypothetical protein GMDG_03541 [Pseudogymnoascus destructans 20631-21]OAF61928.1 hypothetical protein VC83_01764 [Pseudogymnoascus destructans]